MPGKRDGVGRTVIDARPSGGTAINGKEGEAGRMEISGFSRQASKAVGRNRSNRAK
jgi:hypothetical protein